MAGGRRLADRFAPAFVQQPATKGLAAGIELATGGVVQIVVVAGIDDVVERLDQPPDRQIVPCKRRYWEVAGSGAAAPRSSFTLSAG